MVNAKQGYIAIGLVSGALVAYFVQRPNDEGPIAKPEPLANTVVAKEPPHPSDPSTSPSAPLGAPPNVDARGVPVDAGRGLDAGNAQNVPAVTFVGAGDIAGCGVPGAQRTAKLLDGITGTVFTLGDNAYYEGTDSDYAQCYDPFWGRHKARTRPVPGNHDYLTKGAAGYFNYYGFAAGDPSKGYYSYDLGAWHILSLNSNCGDIGGCDESSQQFAWVKKELASSVNKKCVMALWHHPRFTTGPHANATSMQAIWAWLFENNVDVVLTGHDHNYQRWARLDASGNADSVRGIRSFVVGTGGKDFYPAQRKPGVEVLEDNTWGVLKLSLKADGYDWEFVPEAGKTFTDKGSEKCH